MPYFIIIIVVLILSPFILKFAQSQNIQDKRHLKNLFLFILSLQIISSFFNWENFTSGKSGIGLSLSYPDSFLGLFLIISAIQIVLLLVDKSNTQVVILNFINTVLIFVAMIRLSSLLGFQAVSFASVSAVFLVLVGNAVGLAFINKDKNLLRKYFG